MDYQIQPYTIKKAKELGVSIKQSTKSGKKLDVFKNDKLIASIGAKGMNDYPTYLKKDGKTVAEERRKLYLIRHKNDKGVAGFYAKNLLW
jgi:hypothetical protein